jgi:hypothetical protein
VRAFSPTRSAVFVLASPPLTAGFRTLERVRLARQILDYKEVTLVNLFPLPTRTVLEISQLGQFESVWTSGRSEILAALELVDDVVLAYGTTEPNGAARIHHRHQVAWLSAEIHRLSLRVWTVGGLPRHPSRWQRYTHATHFGRPFADALERSFEQAVPKGVIPLATNWQRSKEAGANFVRSHEIEFPETSTPQDQTALASER